MAENVTQHIDPTRFEIAVDEATVGRADYVDTEGRRVFFHTEVDPAYGGRGLAGTLVHEALTATRTEGLRVVPVCSYVARYVTTHPEWTDLVDEPDAATLAAIPR